jgi:hypothetical protein
MKRTIEFIEMQFQGNVARRIIRLFDDYVFLDGSPCGVEVKVDG